MDTETLTQIHKIAFCAARGCYQRALLHGREAWSGKTLRGKARRYSGRYSDSRYNLVSRVRKLLAREIGWNCVVDKVLICSRWRRELVVISPDGDRFLFDSGAAVQA